MVRTVIARLLLVVGFAILRVGVSRAADFYVAPTGAAGGDGSFEIPWSLSTALSQPPSVRPGDTIWIRGGSYRGTFVSRLNGSPDAPIVVRQFPGERATLDGGDSGMANILSVSGSYTWYRDFEITSSDPNRVSHQSGPGPTDIARGGGVATVQTPETGPGLKFINLVVHDTAGGFGLWKEATDVEVSGCIVSNNGWVGPDRGHGHGFYIQNLSGTKRIADNVIFANFSHGIQAYGSQAADIDNITIAGNTIFDNGLGPDYERNVLIGGDSIARNPRIEENVLYYPAENGQNLNVGYDPYGAGAQNAVVTGNYVVNGQSLFNPLNTNETVTGNAFYSSENESSPVHFPSNLYSTSVPGAPVVFIRPNRYETGRANITVVNWSRAAGVPVDIGSLLPLGAAYSVVNAQNFFGAPVARGVYGGAPILLPMTDATAAAPVGYPAPAATGTAFQVFVLLPETAARPRVEPSLRHRPNPRRLDE
ncbi:MAG: right-handed parallel beta-helix repeat-containing protein [Acidobacteriota bacterium]